MKKRATGHRLSTTPFLACLCVVFLFSCAWMLVVCGLQHSIPTRLEGGWRLAGSIQGKLRGGEAKPWMLFDGPGMEHPAGGLYTDHTGRSDAKRGLDRHTTSTRTGTGAGHVGEGREGGRDR
jgi:hypothetical protein